MLSAMKFTVTVELLKLGTAHIIYNTLSCDISSIGQ